MAHPRDISLKSRFKLQTPQDEHKKAARELKPSGLWDELPARTGSIHPL
jgi:hypothetical protein